MPAFSCGFVTKYGTGNVKIYKKENPKGSLFFVYGTPKRIRIAVYTVKGCCPRPLDDGG